MKETTNYKLKKPGYEDYVDIGALNANADVIDAELHKLNAGKSDTVKPSAAGNLAALAADGKLQDSGRKPGEKNGVATLDENGHIPGDQLPNSFLPLKGGTMSGPINMNGQRITGLPKPAAGSDPMRKDDGASSSTLGLFGLGPDGTMDDVLKKLSEATLYKNASDRTPITLNSMSIGEKIKLMHNGSAKEFLVMQKNYEPELNGQNRVLLLQIEPEPETQWDSSGGSKYSISSIYETLKSSYKAGFDPKIQSLIGETKFKAYPGRTGSIEEIYAPCFLLSATEFGQTNIPSSEVGTVGTKVDGADIFWKDYFSKVVRNASWTRSCSRQTSGSAYKMLNSGDATEPFASYERTTVKYPYNPALTLPGDATLYEDSNGVAYAEDNVVEAITTMAGNIVIPLPIVQIATGSYVGTGKYGSSNPNSLTFDFDAKAVFVNSNNGGFAVFVKGTSKNYVASSDSNYPLSENSLSWPENSVKWWSETAEDQLNESGTKYYYTAIG